MTGNAWALLAGLAVAVILTPLTARLFSRAAIRRARDEGYWDGAEAMARASADRQERIWQDLGYPPAVTPGQPGGGRHAAPPPPPPRPGADPVTSEWAAALIRDVESWNGRHQLNGGAA